jgi:hypothetical protein
MVPRSSVCNIFLFYIFLNFLLINIKKFNILRYYYANVDKTREEVNDLINSGKWDTNKFSKSKEILMKHISIDDETSLQKVLVDDKK